MEGWGEERFSSSSEPGPGRLLYRGEAWYALGDVAAARGASLRTPLALRVM